ncbi:uncharacterized protein RHO17_004848 [Thomomys bottae]
MNEDDTALTAIADCDPSINICKNSNLTTVVVHSNKDISTAEDSGLRAVIVHSNEDISSCTTAYDPCPAPDDGNVTESKTEVEPKRVPTSGLPFKIDVERFFMCLKHLYQLEWRNRRRKRSDQMLPANCH